MADYQKKVVSRRQAVQPKWLNIAIQFLNANGINLTISEAQKNIRKYPKGDIFANTAEQWDYDHWFDGGVKSRIVLYWTVPPECMFPVDIASEKVA